MNIPMNLGAAALIYVVQGWIFYLVGMVVIGFPLLYPAHLMQRGMETSDDYAAQHPWRVHAVAAWFTYSKVLAVVIEWALFLLLLHWFIDRFDGLSPWLYAVSFLIFLSALNNAWRGGPSAFNSLSHRLRGGTWLRRDQPDQPLGPIAVQRRGW